MDVMSQTGMGLQGQEEELTCLSKCPEARMGNIVTYVHVCMHSCVGVWETL